MKLVFATLLATAASVALAQAPAPKAEEKKPAVTAPAPAASAKKEEVKKAPKKAEVKKEEAKK